MQIDGRAYRTIWVDPDDGWSIRIIDQTRLPWALDIAHLTTAEEAAHAIRAMLVRGAPLIGATAAYGLCLALREDPGTEAMEHAAAHARRHPPHRRQPPLGARPHARRPAQHPPGRPRRPRLRRGRRASPTRTSPRTRPSAATACR